MRDLTLADCPQHASDVKPRQDHLRRAEAEGGEPVAHEDYYLRAQPTFETPKGQHDWLARHVFIGVGERKPDGNLIRYYALS